MATTRSTRTVDAVVGAGIADWFRRAGFRRKGRSFFRPDGEVIHTAAVQVSKVNRPPDIAFAVNLGIEWPFWHRVWTGRDVGGNPAVAPTLIQARLHPTDGMDHDYWWNVRESSAVSDLAAEVTSALEAYAEGFWRRYGELEALLRDFDVHRRVPTGTPPRLVQAALLTRAGRLDEARSLVAEAARRTPKAASHFDSVAQRLGLGGNAA